jgi:RimJ/RimL family protein N-acetyltransferase
VTRTNEYGQPIGDPVSWTPGPRLVAVTLEGTSCRLEPLGDEHVPGLYDALCVASPPSTWTYMPTGPFADHEEFAAHVTKLRATPDMVPLAILLPDGTPVGIATYLRIDHANGTAEVGYISYSAALQRTTAATEAMYLMMAHVFETIGVRRYEWKCDALNAPSRRAAARLGFTYEGTFRQAVVTKGRNRDTAWFAVTDDEWPRLGTAFRAWLDPANFDEQGRQRARLQDLPRT